MSILMGILALPPSVAPTFGALLERELQVLWDEQMGWVRQSPPLGQLYQFSEFFPTTSTTTGNVDITYLTDPNSWWIDNTHEYEITKSSQREYRKKMSFDEWQRAAADLIAESERKRT